jgi:hypothetical protein
MDDEWPPEIAGPWLGPKMATRDDWIEPGRPVAPLLAQ